MREDETTTAVPDNNGEQPAEQQPQQGEPVVQADADAGSDQTSTPEPEKPRRRTARRRATSAAAVTADPEPKADAPAADDPQKPTEGAEPAEPAAPAAEPAAPAAEPAAQAAEPAEPAVEPAGPTVEDAEEDVNDAADENGETEPQPFVTSLAPQLSHVDAGQAEIELAPPASFNPFALFQAPEEVVRPKSTPRRERDDDRDRDDRDRDDRSRDDRNRDASRSEDEPEVDRSGSDDESGDDETDSSSRRRRRGRRGRGRRADDGDSSAENDTEESGSQDKQARDDRSADKTDKASQSDKGTADGDDSESSDDEGDTGSRRRRRRRRRSGDSDGDSSSSGNGSSDSSADKVKGVSGSVRLEAKRQRRKEGRDHGRRRAPILTEAEFLARRESVTRKMIVRQQGERIQIAVLEDDVLVEHYVTLASEQSFAGGVYLGRVQNVLPSMEAAFIDIGKRRNAVLYAGEVNWDAAGLEGKQRNIEQALKSGDKVLVQVTKDPIGHKGARLTSQISLPGRYLVYVPGGSMTGISRKLPEQERSRLKEILRRIVPDDAGVIIRTAAEGATEEELNRDVQRLKAQWEVIEQKAADTKTKAPSVLYEEPDLAIRVVRDLFNEDFAEMIVSGDEAWDTISAYIQHVAPDLVERISKAEPEVDVFDENRIDEQLTKALDRKVWLPSGGSLVIDRTEAMTVIDVNTGKFTGTGGNLEQTVTKNNLEAAEEIVRQLRLRDIGGIVVIDFIDMLLESNRELVLRRLTECLGRDRTKHQVAEVTSLGLVQMTRKRVGQGLLDAFSEPCAHCDGRGIIVHSEPIEKKTASTGTEPTSRRNSRSRRGGGSREPQSTQQGNEPRRDSTSQLSAIAAASHKDEQDAEPADAAQPAEAEQTAQPATPAESAAPTEQARQPEKAEPSEEAEPTEPTGSTGSAGSSASSGTERRPAARRRRAARRPAGPPASSTTPKV